MSELIHKHDNCKTIHWKLLTGASALALMAYVSSSEVARADAAAKPVIWLEFGGQLERMDGSREIFAPQFTPALISDGILPADLSQKPPIYSSGFEGSIRFEPQDSNWHFIAAIRYGRSNNSNASHQQTNDPPLRPVLVSIPALGLYLNSHSPNIDAEPHSRKLGDTVGRNLERHTILDFQAGRDVGLGVLGGKSDVDFGVRFAQFTSGSSAMITANGGPIFLQSKYRTTFYGNPARIDLKTESWDLYHARAVISRSFKGIGPSLAFNASVPFAGNPQSGELGFDWGVNGAVLFGRQKTKAHHETLHQQPYVPHHYNFIPLQTISQHSYDPSRSRSVTVPNVGGFAAITFRYVDAKISLGYRADFFFNAIDGGIDTRKSENRGFFGPYASISIGFGD